jgi:hypothetical protein
MFLESIVYNQPKKYSLCIKIRALDLALAMGYNSIAHIYFGYLWRKSLVSEFVCLLSLIIILLMNMRVGYFYYFTIMYHLFNGNRFDWILMYVTLSRIIIVLFLFFYFNITKL